MEFLKENWSGLIGACFVGYLLITQWIPALKSFLNSEWEGRSKEVCPLHEITPFAVSVGGNIITIAYFFLLYHLWYIENRLDARLDAVVDLIKAVNGLPID